MYIFFTKINEGEHTSIYWRQSTEEITSYMRLIRSHQDGANATSTDFLRSVISYSILGIGTLQSCRYNAAFCCSWLFRIVHGVITCVFYILMNSDLLRLAVYATHRRTVCTPAVVHGRAIVRNASKRANGTYRRINSKTALFRTTRFAKRTLREILARGTLERRGSKAEKT